MPQAPASALHLRIAQHGWPVAPQAWQVRPAIGMPIVTAQASPAPHISPVQHA